MKKLLPLALFCACSLTAAAQTTFTVASYNVDGLPSLINSDGPGRNGTQGISQKLAETGWDVIGVCENFEYNDELMSALSSTYAAGTFRGTVGLQNIAVAADTDGLNVLWNTNTCSATDESWAAWNAHKGGISDQANDLIKKGYRHYTVTFGGNAVDLYQLHMEAGTGTEEDGTLNEHSLNAQRQLIQLVNAIKHTDNKRPIIVMGDTNCRFTRENMKQLFIDALNADKRFITNDCWVEMCKGGVYPDCPSESLHVNDLGYVNGEVVDKILYINNTDSDVKLTLNNFRVATDFTKADGTFLADHCPVVANFTFSTFTDQEKKDAKVQDGNWSWTGENYTKNNAYYLFNLSRQAFLALPETTIADIEDPNVVPWTITITKGQEKSGEVKYEEGSKTYNLWWGYKLSSGYRAGINDHNPWTSFGWDSSNQTSIYDGITTYNDKPIVSYAFGYRGSALAGSKYRYFQAQVGGAFANGDSGPDATSSWLLVSPSQKGQYEEYKTDYADALKYVNQEHPLPEDVYTELLEKVYEEVNMNNEPAFHEFVEYIRGMEFKDVTITTADYSTLCLPWEGDVPAGVTVYYGTNFNNNGDMIHLEEMNGNVVPKNTGVVLYSDVDKNTTFRFWKSRKTPEADQPANILLGTNDRIEAADRDEANNLYYALSNKTSGVGFYEIDDTKGVAIPANRAYLVKSKSAVSSASAILFSFDDDDYLEEILNVATDENEASVEAIYNAAGARVSRLQEGVNIIRMSNGVVKKVFVK